MDYSVLSDRELLDLSFSGDGDAEQALAVRYLPFIKKLARQYFLLGGDHEDLIQEGTLGLISAIRKFNPDANCSFSSFAMVCIRNRIITAVKSANSSRHTPLNSGVSLDELDAESFPQLVQCSAEDCLVASENEAELIKDISDKLSKLEKQVLSLYLDGKTYESIAHHLNKPVKSVDNAVQRIRHKLN